MQQVGSDTVPRDEVTGLAAFDNLDPVSTLNVMPEQVEPAPRVFAPPPPPVGMITQPPVYAASARAGATLPPPTMPAMRTFNPPWQASPVTDVAEVSAATSTVRPDQSQITQLSDATAPSDAYEGWEDPDEAATRVERPLLEGAAVPAAHLQMDWDDEELPTQMRGEEGLLQSDTGWEPSSQDDMATAAFEPVPASTPSGRPSPFPTARTNEVGAYAPVGSFAPAAGLPSVRPGAPSPFATTEAGVDSAWGEALRGENRTIIWVALGAVAIVALGFGARAMLAPPTPGLVMVTTVPADAHVTIDGEALAATSSPFSAADLAPGVSHEILVQKDGFIEQRRTFTLRTGEAKALSEIKLTAVVHDGGFAISSMPQGADVLVDGRSVGQATPARVTRVTTGLHKLELVHDGYQTFELHIYVPDSAVLELPYVELVPGATGARTVTAAAPAAPEAERVAAGATVQGAEEHSGHRSSQHDAVRSTAAVSSGRFASRGAAYYAPSAVSRPVAARVASATFGAPGKGGTLRVNSRPWAQIFVDNRLVGNTPQLGIQLGAGTHSVKLVNQAMGLTRSFSVRVQAGQTVTKIVNLIE